MTRGTFSCKGENIDDFNCNLQSLIEMLSALEKIKCMPATKNGRDFFDVVISLYRESVLDSGECNKEGELTDTAMMLSLTLGVFKKQIARIFSNEGNTEILKNIGATDSDIALLSNDSAKIKDVFANNKGLNQFELAKKFRMLDVADSYYKENFLPKQDHLQIVCESSDGEEIQISYYALSDQFSTHLSKSKEEAKTVVLNMFFNGGKIWDYNHCRTEYEALKDSFDISVAYGNGLNYILVEKSIEWLNEFSNEEVSQKNFALIHLHLHDNKDQGFFEGNKNDGFVARNNYKEHFAGDKEDITFTGGIHAFPDHSNFVYFLRACYSGQYHKSWHKDAFLVTNAGNEIAENYPYFETEEYEEYFAENDLNAENFIEYLVIKSGYTGSVHHISGKYGEVAFQNMQLADFYKITKVQEYNFQKASEHVRYTLDLAEIEKEHFFHFFNEPILVTNEELKDILMGNIQHEENCNITS